VSFISTIKQQDLNLLRNIVRKVHLAYVVEKFGESSHLVSDSACDKLIESIAPEVVEDMIRFGVDKGYR
jgi:exosortase/archaeosortase